MTDGFLIALAAIFGACITVGVPATITAFGTKRLAAQATDHAESAASAAADARRVAEETAAAVGKPNGAGDIVTMLTKALVNQDKLNTKVNELWDYTHEGVHDIRDLMTPIKGKADILWEQAGNPPFPSEKED